MAILLFFSTPLFKASRAALLLPLLSILTLVGLPLFLYNDPYKSEQKTEELDEPKIEKEETNESSNEEESPQQ